MKLNSRYTWLWVLWALMFGVIEYKAIKDKRKGDTLSEHVWKLIGKRGYAKTGTSVVFRVGIGGLLVWLIGHFFGSW
jgi:hypothetical protein